VKYRVSLTVVCDCDDEFMVAEAIQALLEGEIASLDEGGTRCGVVFTDVDDCSAALEDE
jgi:hypothetical protein